uniref:Immunoglobulin V-set domain-containing protein n=1 Tax=Astyanax mexicanus TaxID=7994 RepID=A0A8B9GQZ2_ASTMX
MKLFTLFTLLFLMEVEQNELSWTKLLNKRVEIQCKVTGLQTSYVHWYHQKDGEGLTRIQYVNEAGNNFVHNSEFSVKKKGENYDLKLNESNEGVYYCACWDTSSHSDSNCSHPLQ